MQGSRKAVHKVCWWLAQDVQKMEWHLPGDGAPTKVQRVPVGTGATTGLLQMCIKVSVINMLRPSM